MPHPQPTQAVRCHVCGHGYSDHRPGCTVNHGTVRSCDCAGFRWVGPDPAPDLLGYHRVSG